MVAAVALACGRISSSFADVQSLCRNAGPPARGQRRPGEGGRGTERRRRPARRGAAGA